MASIEVKRPRVSDASTRMKKAPVPLDGSRKASSSAGPSKPKPSTAPRPAPSFLSALKDEETDFPRGGGSSLTPFELRQVQAEGRREADAEAAAEAKAGGGKRPKRSLSEREAKRVKKNQVAEPTKERDKDTIRVEELNYKRLLTGTHLLTRIHTVLPLHLILSLPNHLLAHVPITEISTSLTTFLSAEEEDESSSDVESEKDEDTSAPDLATLFQPGQYFPAKVLNLYPTASPSFISQYPVTETNRLAARVEMTLVPEKVNSEVAKAELEKGYPLTGEVRSEEDKGWRIGLGLNADEGMAGVEGWIGLTDVKESTASKTLIVGQLVSATISSLSAGGRVVNLSLDPRNLARTQITEASTVGSILPGHLVTALVTAVVPSGLNVQVCAFYDGTIDLAHLGLAGSDIDDKYKVGKKIRARVIYDSLATTPRRFACSVLPHILSLSSPTLPDQTTPIEQGIPIGKLLSSVTVSRVIPEWGVMCRTDDGLEGFTHISHISDDRINALSSGTSQYRAGTLHRARVIGHSPLDGVLLLSFEQKVLDQVFMQVDELQVGQVMKVGLGTPPHFTELTINQGTIHRLTDKALFVNIHGNVDGVVWALHYADIRLKHPEKRFKVGATVRCRVFTLDPARGRVVLTMKRSLVDSTLEVPKTFADVAGGQIMPAVVSKILDKGCIVDIFGGMRAFVPQSEASQKFMTDLTEIFFVGKSLNVRITDVDPTSEKIVASVRQALPTALAAEKLEVGQAVSGIASQIHAEQVVVTLEPSQITALLSLSSLSNHRHMGVDDLRASLKTGDKLEDLVVISKNATSGLVIVANKRIIKTVSGISTSAKSFDTVQRGQIVPGRVISHIPQGTMVQLPNSLRGRVHPCDASDDLSVIAAGKGPLNVDDNIMCYVLKSNPSTRIIDLSTRQSRTQPDKASEVLDKEIDNISDLTEGQAVRGLIKNVSNHGVFVALGRAVTARIMIKELFDDYVKDWQSRFEVNQLVSGKILKVDEDRKLVEMTLRKNPPTKGSKQVVKMALGDFEEGQKVVATVKKVETYGMFLRIDGTDVTGLCHRSEISDDKKRDVSQALKGFREGDQVKAAIVSIDKEKGRFNFGIKASYFTEEFWGEEGEVQDGESADGQLDEVADMGSESGEDGGMDKDGDGKEDDDTGVDDDMEGVDEQDVSGVNEEDGDEDEVIGQDGNEALKDRDGAAEEEGEDEVMLKISERPSRPIGMLPTKKSGDSAPVSGLTVSGGFDWSGMGPAADAESSGTSFDEDESAPVVNGSAKFKRKRRALDDLTATAPDDRPESVTGFERALLASPNSSFLWIQYMSFQLQLHEVDKARRIGRQALEKIAYREEEEKLNVWMALVNLELGFGTEESAEAVFKDAAQFNDARIVHLRYAEALQAAGREEAVEELYKKIVKKFSEHPESWTRFSDFYLKKGDADSARELLPRCMKSLGKTKHVETIEKMAVLEFKHGDAERGKTLFEGLVDRYPRRLDLWSVYIDQLAKADDIQGARGIFDRVLSHKLTRKKAKFVFKKWLAIETRIGDMAGQEKAKERARKWVMANAKPAEDVEEDED